MKMKIKRNFPGDYTVTLGGWTATITAVTYEAGYPYGAGTKWIVTEPTWDPETPRAWGNTTDPLETLREAKAVAEGWLREYFIGPIN